MPNTIFDHPDLSAFTRLDDLDLEVTGQRIWPDHTVLACRIAGEDRWCRRCGCQSICRDTLARRPAHEPYGGRPTIWHVSVRRYRCPQCAQALPRHEPSGRSARQALAVGGALGADWFGRSSFDNGVRRPGPGRVLEEPLTLLSWSKGRVY